MNGNGDEVTALASSEPTFPRNVEEGRQPPQVSSNHNDNLNFGWFSLPRNQQETNAQHPGCESGNSNGECANTNYRPASQSGTGQQTGRPSSQSGFGLQVNRLPSQSGRGNQGSRPPSQSGRISTVNRPSSRGGRASQCGRPASQGGRHLQQAQAQSFVDGNQMRPPSSQQRQQPMHCGATNDGAQRLVIGDDPELADYERQAIPCDQTELAPHHYEGASHCCSDQNRGPPGPPQYQGEIAYVDWPLSRTAQEMMMRAAPPPAEPRFPWEEKYGPAPTSCPAAQLAPAVPPTPMPPLMWSGYRSENRPTYATWREQWHASHGHKMHGHHSNCGNPFSWDTNNNSSSSSSNSNNNNKEDLENSNNNNSSVNRSFEIKMAAPLVEITDFDIRQSATPSSEMEQKNKRETKRPNGRRVKRDSKTGPGRKGEDEVNPRNTGKRQKSKTRNRSTPTDQRPTLKAKILSELQDFREAVSCFRKVVVIAMSNKIAYRPLKNDEW